MIKKEIIWREILYQATEKKQIKFQQKELARKFGFSLSTIFNALKAPRGVGAIEVTGRDFRMRDAEKFLYLWATNRNVGKDIIYKTHTNKSVREMEGEALPKIIFGAYSAYTKKYRDAPADYDKVYFYADEKDLPEVIKRFPKSKGYENLIIIKKDSFLKDYGDITPDVQTFADLWNLSDWYAREFLKALKNKLFREIEYL